MRERLKWVTSQLCCWKRLAAVSGIAVLAIVAQRLVEAQRDIHRWSSLRATGVLRVGIDPSIAGISFFDAAGNWAGYDADVTRCIVQQLGLTAQPVPVGYDGFYDALQTRRVDVSLSALTPESRGASFTYSRPYFDNGPRLVGAAPDALEGKTLAVALGSEADRLARYLERRTAHLHVQTFAEEADAIRAWRIGEADAVLVSAATAVALGCSALAPPSPKDCASLRPVPWVIALRGEDKRLLEAINRAIGALQEAGQLDQLALRWLAQRSSPSP